MNPVQQKISCVYVIGVSDEASTKRKQPYKIIATKELQERAKSDGIASAHPTEKIDGTCCLFDAFQGKTWLWARHDRKPNKVGERKFAQYKNSKQKTSLNDEKSQMTDFSWNPDKDFKDVPVNWMPASGLKVVDGFVVPDKLGHTPGWIPVEKTSRPHCWHLSAVNLEEGLALVLRASEDGSDELTLAAVHFSSLNGQTCELVGTNINGNPYGLGSKKDPLHFLVPHGSVTLTCPSPLDHDALVNWFNSDTPQASVEGVVWHCANGQLYKLHRHHLNLNWPMSEPWLCRRKVRVEVNVVDTIGDTGDQQEAQHHSNCFTRLSSLNGQVFDSLHHLQLAMASTKPQSAEP